MPTAHVAKPSLTYAPQMLKLNVPSPTAVAVAQVSFAGAGTAGSAPTAADVVVAVLPLQPVKVQA
ncbi:hypothetical protein D3C83_136380 [compost metagenome]